LRVGGLSPAEIGAGSGTLEDMSAALSDLLDTPQSQQTLSRRERAAKTVDTALRGGILAGAVGAIAWLAATVLSGTIFIVLIAATVLAVVYTVVRGEKARLGLWGLVAIAWALVIAERWVVHDNGALIIAGATYLGVVMGARKAGIAKKSIALLAYPLISVAIIVAAGQDLLDPWGLDWLWVAAIIGPVVGLRTLLNPSPRDHKPSS
jgi:hypothetical protein